MSLHRDTDDLTLLQKLNTDTVKACLKKRYKSNVFYTWAGPTLVSLNPLKDVSELYSNEAMQLFAHEAEICKSPHIFSIGQCALRFLQWELGKVHKAIIVNGESGAGKTYSAQQLLTYLATMESNNNEVHSSQNIESLICQSNPLLESLGNAQTLRNENSSRFGKLIRLVYSGEGADTKLKSAHIETYLLESTRVARQAKGERNFHIFYQMLSGLSKECKQKLHLSNTASWAIAPSSNFHKSDEMLFSRTIQTMEQMNFGDMVKDIWGLLAAILHLGNVEFMKEDNNWNTSTKDHLNDAAHLLGLDPDQLFQTITVRNLQAGPNLVLRPCSSISECSGRRDTLLKLLYRSLFDTILDHINQHLHHSEYKDLHNKHLCIVDLYGFESFEHGNSLEQLCINYANERLQHYFTVHYLQDQQLHLRNEGLEIPDLDINAKEKANIIQLLDGPTSVFGILNEECYLNREWDDSQLCSRILTTLNIQKNIPQSPRIPRGSRDKVTNFSIQHYAGTVTYSTVSIIEKNRDHVPTEFFMTISESTNPFIKLIIGKEIGSMEKKSKSGRKHTVLAKFKNSLDNLMKTLNSCDVHYVRCIRPCMNLSSSGKWDDSYVEAQLNACGVIDTIKLSTFGYPIRMDHQEFLSRYHRLVKIQQSPDVVARCQYIVQSCPCLHDNVHIGKNQVYLNERGMELMEKWKSLLRYSCASVLQRSWKVRLNRRQMAALIIQKWWLEIRRRNAAIQIQRWWRKKQSAMLLERNLKQLSRSIQTVRRFLIRCIKIKKYEKIRSIKSKQRAVAVVPPLARSISSNIPQTIPNYSKEDLPKSFLNNVVLQLARGTFFYQNGVISLRRPPSIHLYFITRKTCLPYSHVVPKSLLPCGLTDALPFNGHV